MRKIVWCLDEVSACHPEMIGLAGVRLEEILWLDVLTDASSVRQAARGSEVDEVWVASSEDMTAINIAAAVRKDNARVPLFLVLFDPSGSVLSCAQSAGVTGTLSRQGLARRFALERIRRETPAGCAVGAGEGAAADAREAAVLAANAGAGADAGAGAGAKACSDAPALAPKRTVAGELAPTCDASAPALAVPSAPAAPVLPVAPALASAEAEGEAFVLTVVSGSGGAGKSATAVVAAYEACRHGARVVLLDCDLQFGDMADLAGSPQALAVDEVLARPEALRDVAFPERAPLLIAAPRKLEQAEVLGGFLPQLLDALRSSCDVIVVNTGASWAEHHAVLLERSTRTLFLVDQRASSIRACRHALDLCARCGIAAGSFVYAVNRCSKRALFTSIDVSCALQGAHVSELKDGGVAVEELLGAGLAHELIASRNDFCTSVERLLAEILPASCFGSPGSSGASAARAAHGAEGGLSAPPRFLKRRSRSRRSRAPATAGAAAGVGGARVPAQVGSDRL